jgi:two-component system, OmpR family, response regulator
MSDERVILVIDDSEIILERIKLRLEAEGYRVITTTQTVGMARHLRESQLVVIDWHMPGISGGEMLASLRAACNGSLVRPLFYLYTSDSNAAATAKASGFDGHFINKGNDDSLVRQVEAAFRLTKFMARASRSVRRVSTTDQPSAPARGNDAKPKVPR